MLSYIVVITVAWDGQPIPAPNGVTDLRSAILAVPGSFTLLAGERLKICESRYKIRYEIDKTSKSTKIPS